MSAASPHYVRVSPTQALPDVKSLKPFKAVVVLDTDYTPEWQNEVSDWLVASGCRYMMAWGPNCSSWDDSVDWADLEARNFEDDDSKFVMTTWHDDEALESVFWYARFCAESSYDDLPLENTLIVHVSENDARTWMEQLFLRSYTLAEREDDELPNTLE